MKSDVPLTMATKVTLIRLQNVIEVYRIHIHTVNEFSKPFSPYHYYQGDNNHAFLYNLTVT
jgi:hypothetical protein